MTFKQADIKEMIDTPQDHLEMLKSEVVLVAGPSFKTTPVALIAKLRHSESRLTYNQLIKMSKNTAAALVEQFHNAEAGYDQLEDT